MTAPFDIRNLYTNDEEHWRRRCPQKEYISICDSFTYVCFASKCVSRNA